MQVWHIDRRSFIRSYPAALNVLRIPFGPGVSPDAEEEAGVLCTPHSSVQAGGLDVEERVSP
jgi:hypothetical protein